MGKQLITVNYYNLLMYFFANVEFLPFNLNVSIFEQNSRTFKSNGIKYSLSHQLTDSKAKTLT